MTVSLLLSRGGSVLLIEPSSIQEVVEEVLTRNWGVAYADAVLETDYKQLAAKIEFATQVLQSRLLELSSAPEDAQERQRIEDALRTLDMVRRIELRASA